MLQVAITPGPGPRRPTPVASATGVLGTFFQRVDGRPLPAPADRRLAWRPVTQGRGRSRQKQTSCSGARYVSGGNR